MCSLVTQNNRDGSDILTNRPCPRSIVQSLFEGTAVQYCKADVAKTINSRPGAYAIVSATAARPADARQYGSQWYTKQVGGFLMGQLADDDQEEGFSQFGWELGESLLHFVCIAICVGIDSARSAHPGPIAKQCQPLANAPPAINHAAAKDCRQPGPFAPATFEMLAALPRTAQCLLHDVLGIMAIAHQAVSNAIQRRGVIVDQDDKISPRKRHPSPLPFACSVRSPVATVQPHCSTSPIAVDQFVWESTRYSRTLSLRPFLKDRSTNQLEDCETIRGKSFVVATPFAK